MAKRVAVDAIADSLRRQGIPCGVTASRSSGKRIYVVEFYPFLEVELLRLLQANELHLDGLRKLRQQIESKDPSRGAGLTRNAVHEEKVQCI